MLFRRQLSTHTYKPFQSKSLNSLASRLLHLSLKTLVHLLPQRQGASQGLRTGRRHGDQLTPVLPDVNLHEALALEWAAGFFQEWFGIHRFIRSASSLS